MPAVRKVVPGRLTRYREARKAGLGFAKSLHRADFGRLPGVRRRLRIQALRKMSKTDFRITEINSRKEARRATDVQTLRALRRAVFTPISPDSLNRLRTQFIAAEKRNKEYEGLAENGAPIDPQELSTFKAKFSELKARLQEASDRRDAAIRQLTTKYIKEGVIPEDYQTLVKRIKKENVKRTKKKLEGIRTVRRGNREFSRVITRSEL